MEKIESTESLEKKIEEINKLYQLVEEDNDYFLPAFMELCIESLLNMRLISEKGMIIMARDVGKDLENLKNNIDVHKSRLWVCLYFLCLFHLCKCYVSFVEVMMLADEGKYEKLRNDMDQLDAGILIKLVDIKERVIPLGKVSEDVLKIETEKITDDIQAKLFDEHKRKCMAKENYFAESPMYCPAKIPENSIEVK
jgi:hypothetical protein